MTTRLRRSLARRRGRFPLDPAVITPAIREAILAGRFEAEEASQIPQIVRPGDRVLEIGAGIGFISTLLVARSAGSAG